MEPLFQLIHSLSTAEKGYLKKMFRASSSRLLALFDAINAQPSYDEAALLREFQDEKGWFPNFSETRRRLRDLILKALRRYHEGRLPHMEVQTLLMEVELLFYKNLYSIAQQKIQQAKKLAEAAQLPLLKQQVLEWEQRLLAQHPPQAKGTSRQHEALAGQLQENLSNLAARGDILKSWWALEHQFLIEGYPSDDAGVLKKLDELLKDVQPYMEPQQLFFYEQTMLDNLHMGYYLMQGNQMKAAYEVASRSVAQLRQQSAPVQASNVHGIVMLFHNQMLFAGELLEFNAMLSHLQELQAWLAKPPICDVKPLLGDRLNYILLQKHLHARLYQGHSAALQEVIQTSLQILPRFIANSQYDHVLRLNTAMGQLFLGQLSLAKQQLRHLEGSPHVRSDLHSMLMHVRMLAEYDLGNFDLSEHLGEKLRYYLNTGSPASAFDRDLLKSLHQLFLVQGTGELHPALATLQTRLEEEILSPAPAKTTRELLYLLAWVESKLSGRPPLEQVPLTLERIRPQLG